MRLMHLFVALIAVSAGTAQAQTRCDTAGLTLPPGFCATVFADSVGSARHMVVAPTGEVFVALRNRQNARGGVVSLRDTTGNGRADVKATFGDNGGTGIALRGTALYFATDDAVLRYHLPVGNLIPRSRPDTIVRNLPAQGGHTAKTIALGRDNDLFVNIGSRSNSCQLQNRQAGSPGEDPCRELEMRAGIWRFNANKRDQTLRHGERYATGLRNVVALTTDSANHPVGLQHGRDQLFQNWEQHYTAEQGAEQPAEILVRIPRGADWGWPYCYYDAQAGKHVLAPEYGGDGKQVGRCAEIPAPLAAYPAHWAPNAAAFYYKRAFPPRYRGGFFIAFHGSWNRAPLPQEGNQVVFQPMRGGVPAGDFEIFARGFGAGDTAPRNAAHRATGLAVGPDGALYISDDAGGRIWRVTYAGE